MRAGKIPEFLNHGLALTPDLPGFIFVYKLAGADQCYAKKADGNYFPIGGGGITLFQDSESIEFFEPTPGIVSARTFLRDKLTASKSLTTAGTLYFRPTATIAPANQRYNTPEQAKSDNSYIESFDSKSEGGVLINSFDLATGIFTVPETGYYDIGYLFGYRMRDGNKHIFTSDAVNVAMNGNNWITVPGTKASFALAIVTVSGANQLFCYGEKIVDEFTNNLYLTVNQVVRLTAGQELATCYVNDSDLPCYGCQNSTFLFSAVKISN